MAPGSFSDQVAFNLVTKGTAQESQEPEGRRRKRVQCLRRSKDSRKKQHFWPQNWPKSGVVDNRWHSVEFTIRSFLVAYGHYPVEKWVSGGGGGGGIRIFRGFRFEMHGWRGSTPRCVLVMLDCPIDIVRQVVVIICSVRASG